MIDDSRTGDAPRHKSFALTPEPLSGRRTAFRNVINLQVGLTLCWMLMWSLMLCSDPGPIPLWPLLNYVVFDIYLVARDWRGESWRRSAPFTQSLVRISPAAMLLTSLLLGGIGTKLHLVLFG